MDLKQEFDGGQNNQQEEEQEHFHVLAVDDSLIDRKLLEKLLTVSSYKVTCVDSGDKALEFLGLLENNDSTTTCSSSSSSFSCLPSSSQLQELQGSKVNLIMTDYSMPGMSGYDLLKRVKGSTWKDVPVVVMSSENVPSRINMCLEGGAEEFLLKPVKLSDLRKLQSYLLNSLSHPCKIIDNEFVDQNHDNTINDHDISSTNNTNDKSGTNNANKRKALSPDRIERRPKMKELVVL